MTRLNFIVLFGLAFLLGALIYQTGKYYYIQAQQADRELVETLETINQTENY